MGGPRVWLTLSDERAADELGRRLSEVGYDVLHADPHKSADLPLPQVWLVESWRATLSLELPALRARHGGPSVHVVFIGNEELTSVLAAEASGAFAKDATPEQLIAKVDALTTHDSIRAPLPEQPSTVPPRGGRQRDLAIDPERDVAPSSLPGPFSSDDPSHPSLPAPVPLGFSGEASEPRHVPQTEMSPELESLLARAEQRVSALGGSDALASSPRLTPAEEIEAVLPAEVLAALDEPLDLYDDDRLDADEDSAPGTRSGTGPRTGLGTNIGTSGGSYGGGTGLGTYAGSGPMSSSGESGLTSGAEPTAPPPRRPGSEPPQTVAAMAVSEGDGRPPSWPPASAMVTSVEARPQAVPPSSAVPVPPPAPAPMPNPADPRRPIAPMTSAPKITFRDEAKEHVADAAPSLDIPGILTKGDALRVLARAVRSRLSGAVAFEDQAGIRRVVFRDGDFVIAASGANTESLVSFLTERGVLAADAASRLGARIPAFGRYAGAALIANGHLRQDELWPVLRAHAEWVLGRVMLMDSGGASLEREVPPRLQAEPAVFGGATGAEVLVEVARRVMSADSALVQLGGADATLDLGPGQGLLAECALGDGENALLSRVQNASATELLQQAGDPSFATVLVALIALDVLTVSKGRSQPSRATPAEAWDSMDEGAMRQRILARRALVDEGDYFSLLGLPRRATSYDVRRAYTELRRDFEPSRVLTAGCADLKDDVDLIVEVLEEAYEILRDNLRRERYRRALESSPLRDS